MDKVSLKDKHTYKDAQDVQKLLYDNNIMTTLFGSFYIFKKSDKDIDLVVLNRSINNNKFKNEMKRIFNPQRISNTDWGGIFLHNTKYGNIDLFPFGFLKKRRWEGTCF